MRYLFVLALVACFALPTVSQTPSGSAAHSTCVLTREQAPEIRGIRLGMSTEQLLTLFPEDTNRQRITEAIKDSKHVDRYGVGRFDIRPDPAAANPKMAGVNYISIEMIDERVTSVHIEYADTAWENVDQFVAKLSEGLRLPRASWQGNQLKCDGFTVLAHTSPGSTYSVVQVLDTLAPQLVQARREAAKEKVRQAFKP